MQKFVLPGASATLKFRRQVYIATLLVIFVFSILLAIPSAVHSNFVQDSTGKSHTMQGGARSTHLANTTTLIIG